MEVVMEQIAKNEWAELCDRISKRLHGLRAEIEVQSLDLGDQIEAEFLPILGITYDHKDDVVVIALEGLAHLIPHPVDIQTKGYDDNIEAVLIVDKEGVRHLTSFREPLKLPPPPAE